MKRCGNGKGAAEPASFDGASALNSATVKEASADLPKVDETTPEFRDIHFEGLVCAGAKQAIYINGLPELPLRNVDFSNSVFTATKGVEMHNTNNVTFVNVTVNGEEL